MKIRNTFEDLQFLSKKALELFYYYELLVVLGNLLEKF